MMQIREASNNFKSVHLSIKEVLKVKIPNVILRATQVIKIITFSPLLGLRSSSQSPNNTFHSPLKKKKCCLKVFSDDPTQWLQVERVRLNNNYFLQTTKSAGVSPWRT